MNVPDTKAIADLAVAAQVPGPSPILGAPQDPRSVFDPTKPDHLAMFMKMAEGPQSRPLPPPAKTARPWPDWHLGGSPF